MKNFLIPILFLIAIDATAQPLILLPRPTVAASSFSPSDLANLKLWLKADAITGKSDDDPLSQWDDASGNAYHATMSTATNQPLYKVNILNGLPVVRFDGLGDKMDLPNQFSSMTEATIFIVFQVVNDPSIDTGGSHGAGGLWRFSEVDNSHVPYLDGNCYEAFGTTVRKSMGNPTPSLATEFRLYAVRTKASEWTSWIDTVQFFNTGVNTVAFSTTPNIGQGKTTAVNLQGDIAEIVLYSSALSAGDRGSVEDYLDAKYNLGL